MISLDQAPQGISLVIEDIRLASLFDKIHLASMGLYPQALISKIRPTPFGDPMEYLVDNDLLITLENDIAARIFVSEKGKA